MAEVFKLQASIGLDTQKFFEGIKKAASAGADLKKKVEDMATSVVSAQKGTDKTASSIEELGDATSTAKKSVSEYRSDVMKLASAYQKEGIPKSEAMKKAYQEIDKSLYALGKQSDETGKKNEKLGDKTKQAGKDAESAKVSFEKFGDALKTVANTAGKVVSAVAKISTAAVGAAAAGLTALTKQALDASASYEQLKGGVETLFGAGGMSLQEYADSVGKSVDEARGHYERLMSAQSKVMQNSYNAFKTAGMSSNQYMETVTSFSASLLQSTAGDTNIAADIADMAIKDMSDNANKMGTDMQSIQNAYQGFAKQNYTMLDNLKLGYGGTKTEMERLLADAEKLSGQKYSIDSLMDVYNAIHVVQEEMGITGTTAKEAAGTIEGSVGSFKAAWENLITAFGSTDMPIDTFVTNFVDSLSGAAANVVPRIGQIVKSISIYFPDLVSNLFDSLKETIEEEDLGTTILDAIDTLVTNGASVLEGIMQSLFDGNTVTDLLSRASGTVGTIAGAMWSIFKSAFEILPEKIPEIFEIINTMLGDMFNTLNTDLPDMMQALIDNAPAILESGLKILETVLNGITDNLSAILPVAIELIQTVGTFLAEHAPELVTSAYTLLTTIINTIADNSADLFIAVEAIFKTLWDEMTKPENLQKMIDAGVEMLAALFNGLMEFAGSAAMFAIDLCAELGNKLNEMDWLALGKDILRGILNGLESLNISMLSPFKDLFVDNLKDLFGIHSPSTLMRDTIGKNLALGVGVGFTDTIPDVNRDIVDSMSGISADLTTNVAQVKTSDNTSGTLSEASKFAWEELVALLREIRDAIREGKTISVSAIDNALGGLQALNERVDLV